jgi:3-methyladenine DNA glycosylase AlkD
VEQWSKHREEFVKRAAFALIASLALHDKRSGDEPFVRSLKFIQRGATDERNFVKKGVSWGLRVLGRRNASLNAAAVEVSRRLAESDEPAARSIGKEALRELTSPLVRGKLAAKGRRTAKGR